MASALSSRTLFTYLSSSWSALARTSVADPSRRYAALISSISASPVINISSLPVSVWPMRQMFSELSGYITGTRAEVVLVHIDREEGTDRGRCARLRQQNSSERG